MRLAMVIGSSESWADEVERAQLLASQASLASMISAFVVNDTISAYSGDVLVAASLHSDFLPRWLEERAARGYSPPGQVWSHRWHRGVTNLHDNVGGSSSLLALQIALRQNFRRVILCGCPMQASGSHFLRQKPWLDADGFWPAWERLKWEFVEPVRSFSGRTRDMLGEPTLEWLIGAAI